MKLKKSSVDPNRREKKASQSYLVQAVGEASLGLLSKENPAEVSPVAVMQTASAKKSNWGSRLGFGRSSASNANRTINKDDATASTKKKRTKKPVGYTQTLKTPKGMKQRERSSSRTRQRDNEFHDDSDSEPFPILTNYQQPIQSLPKQSKVSKPKKLAPPKTDTEPWTPFLHQSPVVTESKTSQEDESDNEFPITVSKRQLFSDEGAQTTSVSMEESVNNNGGLEIAFEAEAESSRLTAVTAAETISTMSSTTTKSPIKSPMSVRSTKVTSPAANQAKSPANRTPTPTAKVKSPTMSKILKHSPVAHAAAQAIVKAMSGGVDAEDGNEDFGENDFDPNDDASDHGEQVELCSSSRDGSTFQLNLTDSNLQQSSPQVTSPRDGFRLVLSKSSMSMASPKQTKSPQTVASTSSKRKQALSLSASASVLSHQTTTSSSLFSYSSSGGSPASLMSQQSSRVSSAISTPKSPSSSPLEASVKAGPASPISKERQQSKLVLARAFGRSSLPPETLPYRVEVSPAEWDNSERRWKYRIEVTRRNHQEMQQQSSPSASVAVTWRSMDNFVWLEQALNAEFQGGLLMPLLSIAVGMTDLEQATHEVDAKLLRDWLSDVLNGIRGQGELILGHQSVDLLRSEAVEAFLFRNTAPLQAPGNLIANAMGEAFVKKQELFLRQREQVQQIQQQQTEYDDEEQNCQEASMCRPSPRSRHPHSPSTSRSRRHPESFAAAFWDKGPLALFTDELCTGMGCQGVEDSPSSAGSFISSPGSNKKFDRFSCSSRALGSADTLDVQDSFLDSTIASMRSSETAAKTPKQSSPTNKQWKLAQSTSLIQAERDLLMSYRKTALSAMEKVQILVEEEEHIGLAWKRFGIAVSNLFSYEKEVENARLGDKKIHRDAMPYRKVKKSTVDQCMKVLVQQKSDRSVPALKIVSAMLTAYVADLSAVVPSVEAYLEGLNQMAAFEEYFAVQLKKQLAQSKVLKLKEGSSTDSTTSQTISDDENQHNIRKLIGSFSDRIRSLTVPSRDNGQKEQDIVRTSSSSSASTDNDNELSVPASEDHKKRILEDRVLANERLVKESLTILCRSTTMRSARMAYAFFKSEAAQCGLLRSAAASLRSKIDVSNKEKVSQMISRHRAEDKDDLKTELALAQRIINLGNTKKQPLSNSDAKGSTGSADTGPSSDDKEHAMTAMRDNALQVAKERVGRWNADLAMAMMKSVGVNDPNVNVEETTRELRLVRKYAIGLRENLNRCIEAVDLLRKAVLKGRRKDLKGGDAQEIPERHISDTRMEYFLETARLFSGIVLEEPSGSPRGAASLSPKSLPRAGIKLNDPMGWSTPFVELSSKINTEFAGGARGDCGCAAQAYFKSKDSQTEWLLSSLSGLLNEYSQRVEVVESFVYMECVGVQLEKHFNKKRSDALTAFEKKTDVTTAINMATRKRIPKLVEELKAKLEKFGPDVTHTAVKETKEAHLESKAIKDELHELALRRLLRARETSTERVVDLLKFWMKEEEKSCIAELNAIGGVMEALETGFLQILS